MNITKTLWEAYIYSFLPNPGLKCLNYKITFLTYEILHSLHQHQLTEVIELILKVSDVVNCY